MYLITRSNIDYSVYLLILRQKSHSIFMAGMKLTIQTRLDLNSQKSACFCLLNAWIKGMRYHAQMTSGFKCNSYYIFVPSSIYINIDFFAHGAWLVLLVKSLFQLILYHIFPTQIPTTASGLQHTLTSHPATLKGQPCSAFVAFFPQVRVYSVGACLTALRAIQKVGLIKHDTGPQFSEQFLLCNWIWNRQAWRESLVWAFPGAGKTGLQNSLCLNDNNSVINMCS